MDAPTSNTANAVDDIVNHLLANSVMTTGIVVGSILLSANEKLGVEELAVGTGADLIDGRGVEINKDGPGDVFTTARLGEEGIEGAALGDVGGLGVRAAVRQEAVL